jgi:hypothetical protein
MSKYKIIFLSALSIVLMLGCSTEKIENDWTVENLKGKVYSYKEFSYEAIERLGNVEKGEHKRKYAWGNDIDVTFDEKGNEIMRFYYTVEGSFDWKHIYKYDEQGNKIERDCYKSDGSFDWKDIYKNDERGNRIEVNQVSADSSLEYKFTFEYDEKGNMVEENWYVSGDISNYEYKITYEYDEKGNMIESNRWNFNGNLTRTTLKYDEKGNKIEENSHYSYDDTSSDKHTTYQYEYDDKNNWIEKIEFENEIPLFIVVREYEYYE